jgi:hypothetical protein
MALSSGFDGLGVKRLIGIGREVQAQNSQLGWVSNPARDQRTLRAAA